MSSPRSLILALLVATATGCVNGKLHGVPTKDAGALDGTASSGPTDAAGFVVAHATVAWRPLTVALPGGAVGLVTLGKDGCLLTNGHDVRVGPCDGEVTVGAAPARPQGPVENPDGDVNGDYVGGLKVRALGAVPLTWDASGAPPAGYLYTDGAAVGSIPFPLPLDGGTLGICQGFTEAGVPSLVACGNGDAGGITQITQDLLAGPGTGSVTGTVVGVQGRTISDAAPDAYESLIFNPDAGNTWQPALVTLPNGVTGTLTVQLGGTGITDAGTAANLCLLTNGSGGFVVGTCTGSFTPGLDLAANPDGGTGQVLVAKHGNDGGQALTDYTQGWVVDPSVWQWGVTMQAPLDAAAAPASIWLTPAPPNTGATTTAAGTPGGVHVLLGTTVSSGNEGVFEVDRGDGGPSNVIAQITAAGSGTTASQVNLCLAPVNAGGTVCDSTYAVLKNGAGNTFLNAPNGGTFIEAKGQYEFIASAPGGVPNGSLRGASLTWYSVVVANPSMGLSANVLGNANTTTTFFGEDAYSSASSFPNGGPIRLCGGAAQSNGSTGLRGSSYLGLGGAGDCSNEQMVQAFEGSVGHRATCIGFAGTGCVSADIPNGDGPTIFATLTAPTTCGSNYGDIYTDPTTGKLSYCNRSGAVQTFDSLSTGSLTVNSVTAVNTISFTGAGVSVSGSTGTATVTIPGGGGGGCNSVGATTGDVSISSPASCGGSVVTQVDSLTGSSGIVSFVGNGTTAELSWPSGTSPELYYSGSNNFIINSASGQISLQSGTSSLVSLNAGTYVELEYQGNHNWLAGALVGQATWGALYSGLVSPGAPNFSLAANATVTTVNAASGGQVNLAAAGNTIQSVTASQVTINPGTQTLVQVAGTTVASFQASQVNLNDSAINLANSSTTYFQVLPTGTKGSHIAFANPSVTSVGVSTGPYCGTGGPAAVKLYITVAGADYAIPLCNP